VKNPYKILGVKLDATDEMIRKAWLEKVHQFPPETASEKFKEIREAYEKIGTRSSRYRNYLMSTDCYIDSPFEALTQELEDISNRRPPSINELQTIISQSFDQIYSQPVGKKK
jgi:curved DNA-binding protein CbpA